MALLRIADDTGAEYTDLLTGALCAAQPYTEYQTGDGKMERSYALVGKYSASANTRIQIMESGFKALADWGRRARLYHEKPERNTAVWLHEAADDEVTYKRALVYDIIVTRAGDITLPLGHAFGALTIVTTDYWESGVSRTVSGTNISPNGGTLAVSGNGNTDGRVGELLLTTASAGNTYVGIREKNFGTADFDPVFDFTVGTVGAELSTDITKATDGDSLGASTNACTMNFTTTETWEQMAAYRLDQVVSATTYAHFVGSYNVFIGVKCVTGGTIGQQTYGLRLDWGMGNRITGEPYFWTPDAAGFYWIPLGAVTIPNVPYRKGQDLYIENFGLRLFGQLADGTATSDDLRFDVLILVPDGAYARFNSPNTSTAYHDPKFITAVDGSTMAIGKSGAGSTYDVVMEHENRLVIPPEGGVAVFLVAADGVGQRQTTTHSPAFTIYDRFRGYAGNG